MYLVVKQKETQYIFHCYCLLCSLDPKSPKCGGMIKLFASIKDFFFCSIKLKSNDFSLRVLMVDKLVSNYFQL